MKRDLPHEHGLRELLNIVDQCEVVLFWFVKKNTENLYKIFYVFGFETISIMLANKGNDYIRLIQAAVNANPIMLTDPRMVRWVMGENTDCSKFRVFQVLFNNGETVYDAKTITKVLESYPAGTFTGEPMVLYAGHYRWINFALPDKFVQKELFDALATATDLPPESDEGTQIHDALVIAKNILKYWQTSLEDNTKTGSRIASAILANAECKSAWIHDKLYKIWLLWHKWAKRYTVPKPPSELGWHGTLQTHVCGCRQELETLIHDTPAVEQLIDAHVDEELLAGEQVDKEQLIDAQNRVIREMTELLLDNQGDKKQLAGQQVDKEQVTEQQDEVTMLSWLLGTGQR